MFRLPWPQGVHDRGFKCICVYSDRLEAIEALTSLVPEGVELHFDEVIGNDPHAPLGTIVGTLAALKYNIIAAIPGAETGVALADALSEALGVVTNGTELSAARRNKYLMGEAVRDAGVRAVMQLKVAVVVVPVRKIEKNVPTVKKDSKKLYRVRTIERNIPHSRSKLETRNSNLNPISSQSSPSPSPSHAKATTWLEIDTFLEGNPLPEPFKAVVKPVESAGSDDVFLCESKDDVKNAFERINGKINGLGQKNDAVLVQEFLDGTEYVVDSVSLDGNRKVVHLSPIVLTLLP